MIGNRFHRVGSTRQSRRQILVGAGGIGLALAGLATPALANALLDGKPKKLTAASFTSVVNQYFVIDDGSSPEPMLKLVEVIGIPAGRRPAGTRAPFSLIFKSDDDVVLAPQTYEVLHPTLGWMLMFLSPISPSSSTYEAAFN